VLDSQSGFRLFDPRLLLSLPLGAALRPRDRGLHPHRARRARVVEVPISVIYNDKVSGVHPLYDTLRFFRAVAMSVTRCRGSHRLAPFRQMATPAPARRGPPRRCSWAPILVPSSG
jgi:hypothetical protein